jgi:large subunit ribosomal protein L22
MDVKAQVKYIRMSPQKVRLVADLMRGQKVLAASDQLKFVNKLAAKPLQKLLNSAIANAENNFDLKKDNLYIKEIKVDEGPSLKRWMPRARGRATPLRKRTCHIFIGLAELVDSGKKAAKQQKLEAPVRLDKKPTTDSGVKVGKEKDKVKDEKIEEGTEKESGKTIVDPRMESKTRHAKIEGGAGKGFVNKIFRRKSG